MTMTASSIYPIQKDYERIAVPRNLGISHFIVVEVMEFRYCKFS